MDFSLETISIFLSKFTTVSCKKNNQIASLCKYSLDFKREKKKKF